MKALGVISVALVLAAGLACQEPAAAPVRQLTVEPGTRVPLQLINRVSSKNAQPGDQVYLQTAYPIVVDGRVVIPPGSYVRGTITQVKRPGRVAGRGELYLRFDSLTLSNGVTRDFLGRIGSVDGANAETLDKKEGKVVSDSSRGKDAGTLAATTATGTSIGAIAGSASRHPGMGTGIGAAAGAAAGIFTILLTRGPEAILERGSTVDMILDRALSFRETELPTANMNPVPIVPPPAQLNNSNSRLPLGIPR
jgi:type IV secretion system protein VirB10